MGFNALRRYRGTKVWDIGILVSMSVVIIALIVWAVRG